MPTLTIQGGLISTTATLVGDVFEFQRLDNPTFAPGDATITIGGVTTNTTNLPQTIDGELVLELTEPENVIGAMIVLDNPAWTRVVIEIVEGGGGGAPGFPVRVEKTGITIYTSESLTIQIPLDGDFTGVPLVFRGADLRKKIVVEVPAAGGENLATVALTSFSKQLSGGCWSVRTSAGQVVAHGPLDIVHKP